MILITYQKAFALTHNDLHTNNVMFNETTIEYLYYKIDNKYYKVKTYGKIFKIIENRPEKKFTIIFYGGEPLLNFSTIQRIVDYDNEHNA